jgi:hypothetical protein
MMEKVLNRVIREKGKAETLKKKKIKIKEIFYNNLNFINVSCEF